MNSHAVDLVFWFTLITGITIYNIFELIITSKTKLNVKNEWFIHRREKPDCDLAYSTRQHDSDIRVIELFKEDTPTENHE